MQKKQENYQDSPCDVQPVSVLWRKIGEIACTKLNASCHPDPSIDCNAFRSDAVVNDRAVQQRALVFAQMPDNAGQETSFIAGSLANTLSRLSYVPSDIVAMQKDIQALKDRN